MLHRLTGKWVAPAITVIVTLGVVLAVGALRAHSPARAAAASQLHQLAAPPTVSASRFTLVTGQFGSFVFSELSDITSEVQPNQYIATTGGGVVHTKQYGKTKPPSVVLKRALSADTAGRQLFAWHQLATEGNPRAVLDADLAISNAAGETVLTYHLLHAWLSKLEISSAKAGSAQVVMMTATIVCDQIIVA